MTELTASGTRDATTFLRGDNTWAKIDLTPVTSREYWGPGRPDVAGSMDQPGKDWVAAATTGAIFRTTSARTAVQGAMVWRKEGTTWEVLDGDTGWITIPITAAGVTPTAPGVRIRREGCRVTVSIDRLTFDSSFTSGTLVVPVPVGFRTDLAAEYFPLGAAYAAGTRAAIAGATGVSFYGSGALADFRATYRWTTAPVWPATLTI